MAITTEDLRKVFTDPTPLYAVAGATDLAAQKAAEAFGEVPQLVEKIRTEAPKRFESVRATDPKDVQERVTQQAKDTQERVAHQAKDAQDKLTEALGSLDGDLKKLLDQAQELALRGVGRAAEVAVQARETYDELAERGRGAVQTWRGQADGQAEELTVAIEPEPAAKDAEKDEGEDEANAVPAPANGVKTENKAVPAKKTTTARKPAAKKTPPQSAK
ncbi:hypothetical protein [Streptomyces halobius]|uniref:Heparin binding hemagglutinin HbhA n=1 Tax=Streptomyces halobius TaxID=2879846 RepID=A0ABY4M7U8_9ACTN|nr:hypothetical protein [Streptomyces halobius]UQA93864.1 hypothetical protein K9S39_20085 [Streptomyces halobius]